MVTTASSKNTVENVKEEEVVSICDDDNDEQDVAFDDALEDEVVANADNNDGGLPSAAVDCMYTKSMTSDNLEEVVDY